MRYKHFIFVCVYHSEIFMIYSVHFKPVWKYARTGLDREIIYFLFTVFLFLLCCLAVYTIIWRAPSHGLISIVKKWFGLKIEIITSQNMMHLGHINRRLTILLGSSIYNWNHEILVSSAYSSLGAMDQMY